MSNPQRLDLHFINYVKMANAKHPLNSILSLSTPYTDCIMKTTTIFSICIAIFCYFLLFDDFLICFPRRNTCPENGVSFNAPTLSPGSSQWTESSQPLHPVPNQTATTSQNMQISYSNHTVRRTSLVT